MNLTPGLLCDLEYMRTMRRTIHMCPEVGFELPETVALVKRELDAMGIPYTEDYCKCSVVAWLGDLDSKYTIALRADMDALNITEINDVPYKSKIEGKMHACGHDGHTAVLLGAVKALNEYHKTNPLSCRIAAVFQPSEEGMATGARVMVENHLMDEIDFIIGGHLNGGVDTGYVQLSEGPDHAANNVFTIDIKGKSAHGSQPQNGIDAGWMACDLYMRIREFMKNEFTDDEKRVLNVGMINVGTAVNIVPADAKLTCTLRTYSVDIVKRVMDGINRLCDDIETQYGGTIEITSIKELPPLINKGGVCRFECDVIREVFGEDKLLERKPGMGSEDFAWYLTEKPGAYWSYGMRKPGGTTIAAHTNTYDMDEDALLCGASLFCESVVRFSDKVKAGDTAFITEE